MMIQLPADIYDTLELSGLVYGGFGAGSATDRHGDPFCVQGHRDSATYDGANTDDWFSWFAVAHLLGLTANFNDGLFSTDEWLAGTRISWEEYCRRGNIVRVPNPWEDEAQTDAA